MSRLPRLDGGSIPAGAGEPLTTCPKEQEPRVHPRWRGGAAIRSGAVNLQPGPSPLARGSLLLIPGRVLQVRSIPAGAGEPMPLESTSSVAAVHPRWRGGATTDEVAAGRAEGPSPLARGSHRRRRDEPGDRGSIPAGAGEPWGRRRRPRGTPVHPRWRGGAGNRCLIGVVDVGPSPLARGSRRRADAAQIGAGSIPAGAGEPAARSRRSAPRSVHPRWRGGARTTA